MTNDHTGFKYRKPVDRPGVYEFVAAALIWSIVVLAIVVLIGCSPARAQTTADTIPAKFCGEWCVAESGPDGDYSQFRKGRCSDPGSDGVLKIKPSGFEEVESACKLRRIVTASSGLWIGAFKCGGEGTTWTATYAISINPRTNRLTLTTIQRSEDKPEGAR